jgi:hypothetical protein
MRTLELATFFAVILAVAMAASAVVPANGGMVGGTLVTVAASPAGNHLYPRVDGDIATYTNDLANSTISYFDFAAALNHTIPTEPFSFDEISDVNGGVVSFSRQHPDGRRDLMAFDIASATLTTLTPPGHEVFSSAIGADTVAFVDAAIGDSDIFVAHISSPGAPPVNLSNSPDFETGVAISPAGDVVVWDRCDNPITACGVWKSEFAGGTWGPAQVVSDTPWPASPGTDGTTVVYDSDRPVSTGGADIYFQPVAGGSETQLEINGRQIAPRISSGVISFASTSPSATFADVFVYVIATNTLFQVTSTPGVHELLSDITVLPNGDVRVIWAANDGLFGANNIYALTFSVPLGGDTTAPIVAITTPADGALFTKDQVALADYACADEPGGSGLASCVGPVASGAAIDTTTVGGHLFAVTGTDNAGNTGTLEHGYGVVFCVNPFAPPVDDLPMLNRVNAGRAIPVKFSLCGDQGLAIFAAGYPKSQQVACDSNAPVDGIEETLTAGNSSLSYDAAADRYKYVWKTEKSWAGSCRQLVLWLSDGTVRRANFQFR